MLKAPQAFTRVTSLGFHLSFLLALSPVAALAIWSHGWTVAVLVGVTILAAWGSDELLRRLTRIQGPRDWSAPLWGLLLALILPVQTPWFLAVVGAAFAVLFVKGVLGGGATPWINPVLAAWAFLQAGWPAVFPDLAPLGSSSTFDTQGTAWLNANLFSWLSIQLPSGYLDLVLGLERTGSSLVVESGGLLLLGATVYLLARDYFPWQIPAFFFLAFSLPTAWMGGDVLYQIFSGSLLLTLFFLATDPSSRPLGRSAIIVYSLGTGFLAFVIRTWGLEGDGVGYAVLFMNLLVPWIDQVWKKKGLNDFRVA